MLSSESDVSADVTLGPGLFDGIAGAYSEEKLASYGLRLVTPSSEANVDAFLGHFHDLWVARTGSGPDLATVRREMDAFEDNLLQIWRLVTSASTGVDVPASVAIVANTSHANPVILQNRGRVPLIVMSLDFWEFVFAGTLGVFTWSSPDPDQERTGLFMFRGCIRDWLHHEHPHPSVRGNLLADAATIDVDTATNALGLAYAAFSWGFFHELGHFCFGHAPSGQSGRGLAADGTQVAVTMSYRHEQELQADYFGYELFLNLMQYEMQIRTKIPFGPSIDHAPLIALDLIDAAYRVSRRTDLLASTSHPQPMQRASALAAAVGTRLSEEGREFYLAWRERLEAILRQTLAEA
jgi:hypothetical protein